MPRRLLSAAAACTLLLGLAACGEGSDGPVTTPPPEIDISAPSDGGGDSDASDGGGDETDPSAGPDVPAPDPADYPGMDENTEEGAMQGLRYYVAVSMWAHQTGEDATLKALEEPSCEGCPGFNAELPKLQKLGEYWSPFEVTDVAMTPHESRNFRYEVVYSFTIPEHTRPNAETGEPEEYDSVEYIVAAGMAWTPQGWKVGGLKGEWGANVHDNAEG